MEAPVHLPARDLAVPFYDDRELLDQIVDILRDRYPGYLVAYRKPFGWGLDRESKINGSAEQHSADDIANLCHWEVRVDLNHIAIFAPKTERRRS